jgi:fructose-bisphosphate aldolase class 1
MNNISEKIQLLIDVAEDVDNTFFALKLKHIKKDLEELAKDNPNDGELGAKFRKFRKLINQ